MQRLPVEVWSDIACPWCYIGKRRLEAALFRFPHRDRVDVVWRSFELDASAPRDAEGVTSYVERLARKYRCPVPEARAMVERMTQIAKTDGLEFDFERIRPGNTFDAHRLLHLARGKGLEDALEERFLRGYLCEGEPIGSPSALRRMAVLTGLADDDVAATLQTDAFAGAVRAEEEQARELGISGVPFFVIGRRYAISGAQQAELVLRALYQAWRAGETKLVSFGEGAVCGPDGCG